MTVSRKEARLDSGRKIAGCTLNTQRGSVYLEYSLLAFGIAVTGALLTRVHKAFALLIPLGVVVFFMPNVLELIARLRIRGRFRRELAAAGDRGHDDVVVLRNGLHEFDAQALLLDTRSRDIILVISDREPLTNAWEALSAVRALMVGESRAVSFHKGEIRIPPRYILVFEFHEGNPFQLVTLKRSIMNKWIETVRQYFGERLNVELPR